MHGKRGKIAKVSGDCQAHPEYIAVPIPGQSFSCRPWCPFPFVRTIPLVGTPTSFDRTTSPTLLRPRFRALSAHDSIMVRDDQQVG